MVTATAFGSTGAPVVGVTIDFNVTGTNPTSCHETTDSKGQATCTYVGNNVGDDVVVARFVDPGTGQTITSDPAFKTWIEVPQITIAIDIKPKSCPNPLNTNDQGVLPVAILGTDSFDVTKVDVSTIKLAGVSPVRSALEDVATPFSQFTGKMDCSSDCTTAGPDSF